MEQDHYKHTRLEEMDRDPQRWMRLQQIERACAEAGATSPWQVFAVASAMIANQDKERADAKPDR